MAERLYFKSLTEGNNYFVEKSCEFTYNKGFAVSQKQKNIVAFHANIQKKEPSGKILEVSTKSMNSLGNKLSAFNLKFYDEVAKVNFPLENIFQSSKVFINGGPYSDILNLPPKDAKRDERLKNSGPLKHFEYNKTIWPIKPESMFYDWLYIKALHNHADLSEQIMEYNIFTDIEFNHKKSINCQARSAAIFVSLKERGILAKVLEDLTLFPSIYNLPKEETQTSFNF